VSPMRPAKGPALSSQELALWLANDSHAAEARFEGAGGEFATRVPVEFVDSFGSASASPCDQLCIWSPLASLTTALLRRSRFTGQRPGRAEAYARSVTLPIDH
jgi:hypothetical protein